MKSLWMKRISWFAIFIIIVFLAAEIEARRGGGGGGRGGGGSRGGGSRSFSKSSPARGGSLGGGHSRTSSSRSYSRNSPAKSGSLGGYGSSGRGGSLKTKDYKTTASRSELKSKAESKRGQGNIKDNKNVEDLQANRQDWKDQNREDWQDYGKNRQEDRQDFAKNRGEDWQEYGDHGDWGEWHGGEWDGGEALEFVGTAAAISIGTALTVNAINSLSCAMNTVYVGGVSYYGCGGSWYNRGYQSGNVVYVVVNPPPGY